MTTQLRQRALCCLLLIPAAIGAQSSAPWRNKLPAQWTDQDARDLLARSPWSRTIEAGVGRRLTEEELREGGLMGQPSGPGWDGVDAKGSGPKVSANLFSNAAGTDRSIRSRPGMLPVRIVWESSPAIQLAEFKAHFFAPDIAGDGYRIAVYGIPGDLRGDLKHFGDPLERSTFLKREGKKDVKPSAAAVYQQPSGSLVVVYLFPYSAEIGARDGEVRFEAQIGRISVAYTFVPADMEFQGKLTL